MHACSGSPTNDKSSYKHKGHVNTIVGMAS